MKFFNKYFLPGLVFQSVVIGGGYATGRELVEFFLPAGPVGGLLGMLVAAIIWSITMALCFEVARISKSYDYRRFFKQLLGPGWVLFEIAFFALIILILSVIGSASGNLVAEQLGVSQLWGIVGLMLAIGLLVFHGSAIIEKFLAGWSFVLYLGYFVFVIWCFCEFGEKIVSNFQNQQMNDSNTGWLLGGVRYAGYNLATIPAVLFCIRHINTRKEAITAGILAGPLAMIPAVLFFVVMIGFYPGIGEQPVPIHFILTQLDAVIFPIIFQIILFGTFIETGTAMIHSINERVAHFLQEKNRIYPDWIRSATAVGILIIAIFLASNIGLIGLIAAGYGTLTWVFIALIIVPLITVGLWKIIKLDKAS